MHVTPGEITFVLATDDRTLYAFRNRKDAISYCEGIDVEDGVYLFWDEAGAPLEPNFLKPNSRGRFAVASGEYTLVPASVGTSLEDSKECAVGLADLELFSSIDEVAEFLTERRR
jgi:hypothetical protein